MRVKLEFLNGYLRRTKFVLELPVFQFGIYRKYCHEAS